MNRIYRQVGLLPLLSVAACGVALIAHAASSLPSSYFWLKPLWNTMTGVMGTVWFPTSVAAFYFLGLLARRGEWDVVGFFARARRGAARQSIKSAALLLAVALTAVVVDSLLAPKHNALDLIAVVAVSARLVSRRPSARQIAMGAAAVVVVFAILALVSYAFTISKALVFVDRAPHDNSIIGAETALLGVAPHRVIASWAAANPGLVAACDAIYLRLFNHMFAATALLFGLGKPRERGEFLSALAFCYLIGGVTYHLWPGVGPVYWEPDLFRYLDTVPNHSRELQAFLFRNTAAAAKGTAQTIPIWGYISCMPSLHMAHEFVMLWYSRHSRPAFVISCCFTAFTILAIVVLGWHYPIDAVAGAILAFTAIAIARWRRNNLLPQRLFGGEDQAIPSSRGFFRRLVGAARGHGQQDDKV